MKIADIVEADRYGNFVPGQKTTRPLMGHEKTMAAMDGQKTLVAGSKLTLLDKLKRFLLGDKSDSSPGRKRTPERLKEYLRSNGYNEVGEGAFGVTFVKDSIAIKIGYRHDPCYLKYAQYCIKNWKTNVHLPRIFEIYQYKNGLIPYTVTVGEFLEETSKDNADMEPLKAFIDGNYFTPVRTGNNNNRNAHLMHMRRMRVHFANKYASVLKTLDEISKKFSGAQCFDDIHMGNVMIRPGTGDIVVTDPLAPR